MRTSGRWLLTVGLLLGVTFAATPPSNADPAPDAAPSTPFPIMSIVHQYYTELAANQFFIPNQAGVYFLTPSGLNCAIWIWGSFGCTGEIAGAPAGANDSAWFNGNRAVQQGWTAAIQYPPGRAQQTLPPTSFVKFEQTTCAVTPESDVYCGHGEFKFIATAKGTWYKGWNDRDSYVCNAYATCPPG